MATKRYTSKSNLKLKVTYDNGVSSSQEIVPVYVQPTFAQFRPNNNGLGSYTTGNAGIQQALATLVESGALTEET